jgi:hypothetical protein
VIGVTGPMLSKPRDRLQLIAAHAHARRSWLRRT